jgi:hypothetical protein
MQSAIVHFNHEVVMYSGASSSNFNGNFRLQKTINVDQV